ncbi:MAG: iron-containing alcohol dehydrogenase, partial [Chthoniobacteraceae bacterium]
MQHRNAPDLPAAPFDWQARTRLVFGPGTLGRVGSIAAEIGGRRAFIVTDRGIVAAGHAGHAAESLEKAGLSAVLYDGVGENPTT